ncbi:hypothetical protein [Thalassospira xiamenensis]|uniref:DUF2971 domain-containing protein n=1 Tax=Thalassospira xiamenensis TaxID=220697 RepID=A0ABR5XZC4_9PROT|nr:hypothetical protein [Thalassospira xiamenensis]KZD00873.1 hypothetical protein AUP40_21365 [Thalassospira xiamenensis]KZD04131.1 hypothetical protein AUP45_21660 [Thalassospira xiamenensis]
MENKLYHYTSFETFCKIIASQKIRFNSLSNVDDAEEGHLNDFPSQAPYTFVSCWTKAHDEKVALWRMYAPDEFSVRIGVDERIINPKYTRLGFLDNEYTKYLIAPLNIDGSIKSILRDVEYVDDPSISMVRNIYGLYTPEYIDRYALTKRKEWAFQSETRYVLQAIPNIAKYPEFKNKQKISFNDAFFKRLECEPHLFFREWIINDFGIDIENLDIPFNMNYMKYADILLGPSTTISHENILTKFVKSHIPEYCGCIHRSKIHQRVK